MTIPFQKKRNLTYPFLAGLLDGDGHIVVYKVTGEYVITMHIEDKPFLLELQQQFGGYLKKVANKNAMRFHLNQKTAINGKDTLVELTKGLNGHIRNTIRVKQFKKLCQAFSIDFIKAVLLNNKDGYIAGLFTADGTIYMNSRPSRATKSKKGLNLLDVSSVEITETLLFPLVENLDPQEKKIQKVLQGVAPLIAIKIFNKYITNVDQIAIAFGFGNNYFAKGIPRLPALASEGGHYFYIKKEEQVLKFVEYMALHSSNSIKHKRLNLVKEFYRLKTKKAHLPGADAFVKNAFEKLIRKWYERADAL